MKRRQTDRQTLRWQNAVRCTANAGRSHSVLGFYKAPWSLYVPPV